MSNFDKFFIETVQKAGPGYVNPVNDWRKHVGSDGVTMASIKLTDENIDEMFNLSMAVAGEEWYNRFRKSMDESEDDNLRELVLEYLTENVDDMEAYTQRIVDKAVLATKVIKAAGATISEENFMKAVKELDFMEFVFRKTQGWEVDKHGNPVVRGENNRYAKPSATGAHTRTGTGQPKSSPDPNRREDGSVTEFDNTKKQTGEAESGETPSPSPVGPEPTGNKTTTRGTSTATMQSQAPAGGNTRFYMSQNDLKTLLLSAEHKTFWERVTHPVGDKIGRLLGDSVDNVHKWIFGNEDERAEAEAAFGQMGKVGGKIVQGAKQMYDWLSNEDTQSHIRNLGHTIGMTIKNFGVGSMGGVFSGAPPKVGTTKGGSGGHPAGWDPGYTGPGFNNGAREGQPPNYKKLSADSGFLVESFTKAFGSHSLNVVGLTRYDFEEPSPSDDRTKK